MIDLVKLLRAVDYSAPHDELCRDAADEIERLREANKWLDGSRLNIWPELRERAERAEAERDALREELDALQARVTAMLPDADRRVVGTLRGEGK